MVAPHIVMQNDDGSVVLWDMSGTTIVDAGLVAGPRADMADRGHGRFLRHGNTAIVLQNTDGSVVLWDMSGTTIVGRRSRGGPLELAGQGHGRFLRRR